MAISALTRRDRIDAGPQPAPARPGTSDWRTLYAIAGWSAIVMLALIPLAVLAYVVWPPPYDEPASEWITLYQENWFRGLVSLDLIFLLSNVLLIPLYLAFYAALKRAGESLIALAVGFGFVGLASYFSSNTAFQMLMLSHRYERADTDADRAAVVAAGEAMLATFEGTAFNVYYVFSAMALLLIAFVMLNSTVFTRTTAWVGLISGVFMIVPATAGTIGIIFSLASLVPWMVFLVMIARQFRAFSQTPETISQEVAA